MNVPPWAKDVIKWIIVTFGKDIVIIVRDQLKDRWSNAFRSKNILILGPRQSGKSSLLTFMRKGRPFELKKGEIITPDPTTMAVIVDKKVRIQKENWLKLRTDVPGDLELRSTWKEAINDIRPHGIIYMIDGRFTTNSIEESVEEIFNDVFIHYKDGLNELAAFHIFLNFCDHWAKSEQTKRDLIGKASQHFEEMRTKTDYLDNLLVGIHSTQLSPNKKTWEEVTRALHHFGSDLMA